MYFARSVLLPFALALLLNFLLRPLILRLEKLHIGPSFGAALVLALFIALIGGVGYALTKPAQAWIAKAPQMAGQGQRETRPTCAGPWSGPPRWRNR